MSFHDLPKRGGDDRQRNQYPRVPADLPLAVRAEPPAHIRIPVGQARWRALHEADVGAMARLQRVVEDHDRTPFRTTESELVDLFEPDVPHSAYGAFDDAGELVAYGYVRVQVTEQSVVRATCSGAVHPSWRDRNIGTSIVAWQLDIARHLLAKSGLEGPAQIAHFAEETVTGMIDLLERNGFTARRWFTQMRRDLSEEIPDIPLGPYLAVVPWSETLSDAVRRAHNQAFADHGESGALTPLQWERLMADVVREWSFVALDRSTDRARVAGYILSSRWEEDWQALGWREGYIEALGVLAPWRRRGVARALLCHSMRAFRESGMDFAGIDVDLDDPAGAQHLYVQLGFEPTHRTVLYAIDL